jgi:hypothetical protein
LVGEFVLSAPLGLLLTGVLSHLLAIGLGRKSMELAEHSRRQQFVLLPRHSICDRQGDRLTPEVLPTGCVPLKVGLITRSDLLLACF